MHPELQHLLSWMYDYTRRSALPDTQVHWLRCLLFSEIDDMESAEAELSASLFHASPADHDFLTKLQALWMLLMDSGKFERAQELVLHFYRYLPMAILDEAEELLRETLREVAEGDSSQKR